MTEKIKNNSKKSILNDFYKEESLNMDDILKLAEECCVNDNALFISILHNYETVQLAISRVHDSLENDDPTVTKEYVRGRENVYANPLIKELPKLIDASNKTMSTMLKIIDQFGRVEAKTPEGKLDRFMKEYSGTC